MADASGNDLSVPLKSQQRHHSHGYWHGFAEASQLFRKEKLGNSWAYADVVCGTGVLLGVTTWCIQSGAAAIGSFRGAALGGSTNLGITILVNVVLAATARLLVRTTPSAEGSGYPQMKAMFFGNTTLADSSLNQKPASLVFLSARTFWVKATSLMLVVSAGLPIGQEGPNVHMAACIARHIRPSFFERNLQSEISVHILHAACACGVAATFNSPLGGVLLSLELMLPQIYTFQVYWGCFVAAFCGAASTYLLKFWASGVDYAQLLDSDVGADEGTVRNYPLSCSLICLLVGAVFGMLGGIFNLLHDRVARASSKFCAARGAKGGFRWRDLAMVAVVTALNSSLTWQLPLLRGASQPQLLNGLFSKAFDGNSVWILKPLGPLLTLLAATLIKLLTTILALSCPTPTGVIAPTMVLGALMARLLLCLVPEAWLAMVLAAPGEDPAAVSSKAIGALAARLAIVGSAAFACGVSRAFGVAITTFEVLSLDSMVLPLSLSSLAAIFTANLLALPFFDLGLVRKGWGCISELTCTSRAEEPAFEIMQAYTEFPALTLKPRRDEIERALNFTPLQFNFPIVGTDDYLLKHHPYHSILLGAITREALEEVQRQLEANLHAHDEVDVMQLRFEGDRRLVADPAPLAVDPLSTAQELYVMLKVMKKDCAYVTGHGVLLGRISFQELLGKGIPITKGMGAAHTDKILTTLEDAQTPTLAEGEVSPESWVAS